MKKSIFILLILLVFLSQPGYAASTPHHLYNTGRRIIEAIGSPFHGIFIQGPTKVKDTYVSEVWEQEKPEKRGKLIFKTIAVLRAPAEEAKGIINGCVNTFVALGKASNELLSLFFGD